MILVTILKLKFGHKFEINKLVKTLRLTFCQDFEAEFWSSKVKFG